MERRPEHERDPGRTDEPTRPAAAPGAAAEVLGGRRPRLTALASAVGNAAFARAVSTGRVPAVQRVPGSPTAAPGASREEDVAALADLVRPALVATLAAGGGQAEFVQLLHARLEATFPVTAVVDRVDSLTGVAAVLGDRTLDHVGAAELLILIAGLPPELGAATSYGQDAYLRLVSRQIARYLAHPLHPLAGFDYPVETLSAELEWVIEQWETAEGILDLELEGTVDALLAARERYVAARGPDGDASARATAGREVAELSRRALLVDDTLRRLRAGEADELRASGPGPLEDRLEAVAREIDHIRDLEGSEQRTLAALGDRVELLAPVAVTAERRAGDESLRAAVLPEEALPATTDRASEQMIDELAGRVERQAADVARLREQVVPEQPTYDLPELAGVLVRWHAFMGPRGRDESPLWQQIVGLYDGLMAAYSHAGTEGGVGRALLMRVLEPAISRVLPGAHGDFAREIAAAGPERVQDEPAGTATAPEVGYAQRFRAGPEVEATERGERESRAGTVARGLRDTPERFREVERQQRAHGPGRGGRVHFLSDRARQGWSYLVVTEHAPAGVTREERSLPPEVAAYLFARTQQLGTLERSHQPGIGEASVRADGIEAARGTNVAERLHGDDEPRNRAVERDRATIAGARRQAGATTSPRARPAEERVVGELLRDFTRYFDGFFAEHPEREWRVAGVLYVAQVEYDVVGRFLDELTPAKLAQALALAASVAASSAMLSRLGSAGRLAAQALGRAMRHAGLTDPAAAIGILAWVEQASQAGTFHEARTKAFFARTIAADLGGLIQGALASSAVAGVQAVRGMREPRTAYELVQQLDPLLSDPASREVFRQEIADALARRRARADEERISDPEVTRLQAVLDALDGHSVAGRPSPDQVDLTGGARTAQGTPRGGPRGPGGTGGADPLREAHEGWVAQMRELTARPAGEPVGPPLRTGEELGPFASAAEAYRAYEAQIARPGGLEVGVFRQARTGEYVVKTGTRDVVREPRGDGPWEGVVHYHVNEANVLTFRMPAPKDVHGTMLAAFRAGQPVTEFVEFPLPDGSRGRTLYRADADGSVTVEILREGGQRETRRYDTVEDYARAYDERTRYLDPDSPEYQWVLADLADYYRSRSGDWDDASGRTGQGAAGGGDEAWLRALRERLPPEVQATMDDLRGGRPDAAEFRAWLEQRGDPERFLRGQAARTPRRAAARAAETGRRIAALAERLDGGGFFARADVADRIRAGDHEWLRGAIAESIGAGHARDRYPADRGYEVLTGIHIVQDTGFTSLRAWRAANPDRPEGEVYLANGRVWVRRGEFDVLVLRLREDGMREVVEMEEIKSGARDSPSGAREQVGRARDLLATIGPANPDLRLHDRHVDITAGIDAATAVGVDKAVTRGPERGGDPSRHRGQPRFDRSLGLATNELDALVRQILAAGGRPPAPAETPEPPR